MKLPKVNINLSRMRPKLAIIGTLANNINALPVAAPFLAGGLIRIRLKRHFSRFTPGLWIWASATALLTFIAVLTIARIFLVGSNLSGQAIETGQRVVVHIADGDVEGNARHTAPVAPAAPAALTAPAAVISADGLAPAPLEAISMQTDKGLVPKIGADGTLPWKYYARPFTQAAGRPIVAIVMAQLGLSKERTEEVLTLPHNLTLSFSPYAGDAHKWGAQAREAGFETLVDLPMQSPNYLITGADPGPYGLLETGGAAENSAKLSWVLSRFSGYVGTLAPEDESLTANIGAIRPTLSELAGHGVLFLYIRTPKNAGLADVIKERQFSALGIDAVIDDDIRPGPIDKQLAALTALARTQGYAIGFARPYPPTLAALSRWFETLNAEGVDLAPVSAIGKKVLP